MGLDTRTSEQTDLGYARFESVPQPSVTPFGGDGIGCCRTGEAAHG